MKTIICIIRIALVWLAIAIATAFVWHRLRRHEKWMESLEEFLKNISSEDIPPEFARIANDNFWDLIKENDDTDATSMGMDKAEELTKTQLDRLPRPDCPDCSGKGYTYSDPDGKQMVCGTCEGKVGR